MSAYACEPGQGSEPGVGWNWALQAARHHDVWVITRANNREAIESALIHSPNPRLHFIYHDLPGWVLQAKRTFLGVRGYYLLWQLSALNHVRCHHRQIGFDIIHHVTFNAIDSPGFLWALDVPFIWGPVGGAQVPPVELKHYFGKRWLLERIRIARKRSIPWNPIVRLALRNTNHVLAANGDTEALLRRLGVSGISKELETAIEAVSEDTSERPVNPRFTALWVGRLSHRKAPILALDIVEELTRRDMDIQLIMVGDGPLRPELSASIIARKLEANVALTGQIPYADIAQVYDRCNVFLFTSLHDTSGNVLLEAMAHGLPIITLDQHGAAEIVTPDCGFKIPIQSGPQVVRDMATAIEQLSREPELVRCMGDFGRSRVRERFLWASKGTLLLRLYDGIRDH